MGPNTTKFYSLFAHVLRWRQRPNRKAHLRRWRGSIAHPITVYLGLLVLGVTALLVKAAFLLHVGLNSPSVFHSWGLFDYIFLLMVDASLYLAFRFALDFIRRFPLTQAQDILVLRAAYVLTIVLTWYTVSSAHFYLLMGDHLTAAVFVAADVGRMTYLRPRDYLILVLEFSAVIVCFVAIIPRIGLRSRFFVHWLLWKTRTMWLVCGFLVLGVVTLQLRRPAWAFNLEKNAVVTALASLVTYREGEQKSDYSFPRDGALTLSSKYSADAGEAKGPDLPGFSAGDKPNVIIFIMESASARHLPSYGNGGEYTPNFDRLASRGALFERFYGHTSNSANAIPCLFCSMYPHPSQWASVGAYPDIDCDSLQQILKRRGYSTAIFSRWDFDFMSVSPLFLNNGVDRLRSSRLGWSEDQTFIQTEEGLIDYAIRWVREQKQPFCLTVWPVPAHMPGVELEKRFLRFGGPLRSYKEQYYNQLLYQDYLLGVLVKNLEQDQVLENSILVLVGDHGEGVGTAGADYAHSNYIYEDVTRIPLLMVAPRIIRDAMRITQTVQQIDLVPTLTGVLGLRGNYRHQGRDVSLNQNRGQRVVYFTWAPGRILGLVDGDWKYIVHCDSGLEELYHISSDAMEHHNLAGMNTERGGYYRGMVEDWAMYEQRYYQIRAGVQNVRDLATGYLGPRAVRLPEGERVHVVHAEPRDGKQLYTDGRVYANGFSITAAAEFTITMEEGVAERFEAVASPEAGYCDQASMPWNLVIRKGERISFTGLFQNCGEQLPIQLNVTGYDQMRVSIRTSKTTSKSRDENRLVFGNAAVWYRRRVNEGKQGTTRGRE